MNRRQNRYWTFDKGLFTLFLAAAPFQREPHPFNIYKERIFGSLDRGKPCGISYRVTCLFAPEASVLDPLIPPYRNVP